jgi:2-dehydro-3-deoxyglucarate aldolase/4-hydroxy-2-oxoheptanedioate aldolase
MRDNKVKRTLRGGGVSIGTMFFEFNTTGNARIAAHAGADFALFDTEHTGWDADTLRMLMATSRAADIVPLVRVPATQYHLIARPLDIGAMGLMIPMTESEEQARLFVRSAKYPPEGGRGAAFGVAHDDYEGGDVPAKMTRANAETLLICLVETLAGIEHVDAIAAVEGVDVIWIGHYDLTNSMGIPGQFGHPRFLQAVDRVLDACRRHGKAPGFMAADADTGKKLIAQGFRCIAYSGDIWVYAQALRSGIAALREGLAPDGTSSIRHGRGLPRR